MEIEVVQDPDEIRKVIPVIRSAWGMNSMDQLVKDIIAAMRFHGGLVLLARDGDNVIGMHFSFTGRRNGRIYLYSHMTGVIGERKYSGIGEKLKLRQRQWAAENGYDLIAWTYDPLMSLNANFNIHKLGAIARTYLRNFYGEMEDSLNFGIPTDRFVAEWWINRDREHPGNPDMTLSVQDDLSSIEPNRLPDTLALSIPNDYVSVKKLERERALSIRMTARNVLEKLFREGFVVVDFRRDISSYILIRMRNVREKYGENIFQSTI